jgi:hypothetical protein
MAAEFIPINNLRQGEVLVQTELSEYAFPGAGHTCEVYHVFRRPVEVIHRGILLLCDFSVLAVVNDTPVEMLFDSRYFKRFLPEAANG